MRWPRDLFPRKDLQVARSKVPTVGKVIPELKFVFWQRMFTARHDIRIWNTQLLRVMPNLDATKPVANLRTTIYDELEEVRRLRNRIAHHEPIFTRDLLNDYHRMLSLVGYRCAVTAAWMDKSQQAEAVIATKPKISHVAIAE